MNFPADERKLKQLKRLAVGWRAKGLRLSSKFDGQVGDALKALLETCAEELEEILEEEE